MKQKKCKWCGKAFTPEFSNVCYCSEACKQKRTIERKNLKRQPKMKAPYKVVSKAEYDSRLEKEAAANYEKMISMSTNYKSRDKSEIKKFRKQQFLEIVDQVNLEQ